MLKVVLTPALAALWSPASAQSAFSPYEQAMSQAVAYLKKGGSRRAGELFAKVGQARPEDRDQLTRSSVLGIVREASR
jgi:hypothetical protein